MTFYTIRTLISNPSSQVSPLKTIRDYLRNFLKLGVGGIFIPKIVNLPSFQKKMYFLYAKDGIGWLSPSSRRPAIFDLLAPTGALSKKSNLTYSHATPRNSCSLIQLMQHNLTHTSQYNSNTKMQFNNAIVRNFFLSRWSVLKSQDVLVIFFVLFSKIKST